MRRQRVGTGRPTTKLGPALVRGYAPKAALFSFSLAIEPPWGISCPNLVRGIPFRQFNPRCTCRGVRTAEGLWGAL
jgi:hypothetical protein